MHKLFFALLLLGASTWGLSQLFSGDTPSTAEVTHQGEPRCELESVSLRSGEVIDLPSGNYLSFALRPPLQDQWLPIDLQVQSPDGEVVATFSQLLREGSSMTIGSSVIGPEPVSIRCML